MTTMTLVKRDVHKSKSHIGSVNQYTVMMRMVTELPSIRRKATALPGNMTTWTG